MLPNATVCKKTAKTEMCEVQMESLRKAKADTSNCVQEDCQKGGRGANAAEAPVREKTARGECSGCQKQLCARRLRNKDV